MLGKTHMAVGIGTSLMILQPKTLPELVLGTGIAAIGGVLSDIDIGTSQSHKEADKILELIVAAIVLVIVIEEVFHLGIYQKLLQRYSSNARLAGSVLVFLGICVFGMHQPHRGFMHSFLALFLLSESVNVFLPMMMPYFGIAFLSHLVIDLFNRRKEKLLYPLGMGFGLGLCSSKGIVNRVLFYAGCAEAIGMIGYTLIQILYVRYG